MLFLSKGGKELWQVDSEDVEAPLETILHDYCTENGLHGSCKGVQNEIVFFEIDSSANIDCVY